MRSIKSKGFSLMLLLALCAVAITGCGGDTTSSAQDQAVKESNALQSQVYQTKHNIDFRNYNLRQKVSDDPATILWCTFFPSGIQNVTDGSTPGQAITVPIAGKLTSSNKRPYDNVDYWDAGSNSWYPRELPGPDKMYGASAEYRYGFDPTLTDYQDVTALPSYCTTNPKVWQTQKTQLVVETDKTINGLTKAAEASIRAGNPERALALLKQAETSYGKKGQ